MGLATTSAGNDGWTRAVGTAPIAYPTAFGCWAYPTSITTAGAIMAVSLSSSTASYYYMGMQTSGILRLFTRLSGTGITSSMAGSCTLRAWHYIVARWISTTNRWIECLYPDGSIEHVQDTTSNTVSSSPDTLCLSTRLLSSGPSISFEGSIAEAWFMNGDIWPAGQMPDEMIRALAYNGPFGVGGLISPSPSSFIEYQSLRLGRPKKAQDRDAYSILAPTAEWTIRNSPTLGLHPPLRRTYRGPPPFSRIAS